MRRSARPASATRHAEMGRPEPIAIVGMSACFPQADDPDALWEALEAGRDCIGELPVDRWNPRVLAQLGLHDAPPGTKFGGFIKGLADFDPLFFGISPREAEIMDPQQRLILQSVWNVIEDAGYAARSLAGTRTALFIGMSASGYDKIVADAGVPIDGLSAAAFLPSIGPNRASYFFDLRGPSEPIETACSSSLVAVHRAALALANDRCDMAIVGGVNAILNPARHIGLGKAGMLSPDGRCRTFSARANGYVRGEGAGLLLLKKLGAAERDGDHVYAVIRGSAENHGGRSNSLTAPSPLAQADVVKAAWMQADVDPRSVTYIEAHGTGTPLGDPIEINALKSALRDLEALAPDGGPRGARCGLGSIKTNIGHLEMAAGVAGLIKVILQLRHRTLVRSLHCEELNPYIQFDGSPFYVVRENQPWEPVYDRDGVELPRRAGVSSFGFGGVNAHVVLEEYVAARADERHAITAQRPALIVLSAASDAQLDTQVRNLLAATMRRNLTQADLASLAFTLQAGREAMTHRLAFTAASVPQLQDTLTRILAGRRDVAGLHGLHTGICTRHDAPDASAALDMSAAIDIWRNGGSAARLLGLWAGGAPCDWSGLYGAAPLPKRMSLPTYPFAKERCWVPASGDAASLASIAGAGEANAPQTIAPALLHPLLHPLLHANVSDLEGLRFSSTFTGDEAFIADHLINGAKVLPSAVPLEMVRAAIEQMAGTRGEVGTDLQLQLKNVVWLRPLVAQGDPMTIDVRVRAKDDGDVAFEVTTAPSGADRLVHVRGSAAFGE